MHAPTLFTFLSVVLFNFFARGSVPITICLANKALKQHLPIETTMDVLKQFKTLEQVYTALELNCDQEAQIPVHSNKPIAVFCLRDQFFIAGQIVERERAIERHDNPEAEEQIRIPAFGDDYDMHEYMRMAEYAGATEELKKKFILRGPNNLVQSLAPYLLNTQKNKQFDDAYVQFIFPQALKLCSNDAVKKDWQNYFYDKLYSNEEFRALRTIELQEGRRLEQLVSTSEWKNWRKTFACQSFVAACDDIERQLLDPVDIVAFFEQAKNVPRMTWDGAYTHLPLILFYMNLSGDPQKNIDFLANKTVAPSDWDALEYYTNVQRVGGEITLCISDLKKVPWQQLQSLRYDTRAGYTRRLCFKMPSSEIAKQLPKEMRNKTLYLHTPIQFKHGEYSDNWFFKFIAFPYFHFLYTFFLLGPPIDYLWEYSAYETGIKKAVNILNPETCALIKKLITSGQSILPGVVISVSKPVEKLIAASAQKCFSRSTITLPFVQNALEAIKEINSLIMPKLFGFNAATFYMGVGAIVCCGCLLAHLRNHEKTERYVVSNGRGSIRIRKPGWFFPEYFFDTTKGCQVTIKTKKDKSAV